MIIAFHLLLGWLIADFISGILHWLEDRVLWVGMPVISKSVVEPNRLHHIRPAAFLEQGFLTRNSTGWVVALQLSFLWIALIGFSFVWLGATLGGLVATEVHARAHRKQGGTFIGVLQDIGIIQSTYHHGQHHRGDFDRRYCVLTGWLNPVIDWIGLWAGLEKFLTIIGLKPNRGTK